MLDSQEEKLRFSLPKERLKLKRLMKEKLKVTNIAGIKLEEESGEKIKFRNLFTFKHFLGTGGFGFVVSADNLETGETIAIKVSSPLR